MFKKCHHYIMSIPNPNFRKNGHFKSEQIWMLSPHCKLMHEGGKGVFMKKFSEVEFLFVSDRKYRYL